MLYYVYELIDPRNNEPFYVGKGKNKRMYSHVQMVKRNKKLSNPYLQNKINKILNENQDVKYKKIFSTNDEEIAYQKEMDRIAELGTDNLCNLTHGGEGLRPTDEIRQKLSINSASRRPDVRKKISENNAHYWKGKIRSDEVKEKMRNSQLGKTASPEARKKMSEAKKGKAPWNKGKKGLQVAWNKGLTKEDDRVKKYTDAKIGRKHSDETKRKISKSKKGLVPWNKNKKGLQVAWNKGLTIEDDRVKKYTEIKIKNGKTKGKPPWNKGLKLK